MEAILERISFCLYYHIALRYFVAAGLAALVFYVIFRKRMPLRKIQERFPKSQGLPERCGLFAHYGGHFCGYFHLVF